MWITLQQELELDADAETLFDMTLDPALFPDFAGYGPIPGIVQAVARDGGGLLVEGSLVDVRNSDGSTHVEEITVCQRPRRNVRELREFGAPFGWLVRRAEEEWRIDRAGRGCRATRLFRFELRSPLLYPVVRLLAWPFERAMDAHARTVVARLTSAT